MKITPIAATVFFCIAIQNPNSHAQMSLAPGATKTVSELFAKPATDELLDPERAFQVNAYAINPQSIVADLVPANGYYIYRNKVSFTVADSQDVSIKNLHFPQGAMKTDQIYGRTEVFNQPIKVTIHLHRAKIIKQVKIAATYQGCQEKLGVCYPPVHKTLSVTLP